jgi:four helix bundle protein
MKGDNIADRLLDFAARILRRASQLPADAASRHIARQLLRAGTAGGANYEEARAAESRADFVHKVSIASKEVREACYWLKLMERAGLGDPTEVRNLASEANELISIFTASIRAAKQRDE